ncbi:MAG: hypothetical protein A3G34_00975 [Candidatus Lindowbacteria bacterium RIFCSPLOWO2_12_FULL_62_27]|nr:MAG: hypothetical protein A3G34_00975 [Candidatus Lindowbacteria bacterium RIFCSPLOWO2_12_FULL_62_27]OGH58278.1 MAG: hypothetical protein A3I06_09115 [Candidatus Lindowbacteria bacterium RIFCSPLOWO2_02_FULL_62_12]
MMIAGTGMAGVDKMMGGGRHMKIVCSMCGEAVNALSGECRYCGSEIDAPTGIPYKSVNVEKGWPTVEEARERTRQEIAQAKARGVKVLKIIHGYGSSGVGGKLKQALLATFSNLARGKHIAGFLKGEDFHEFNQAGRSIILQFPFLQSDADYGRKNEGVTLVAVAI